jgi:RNA polymerase sigma-70 factor, ECF subfamily
MLLSAVALASVPVMALTSSADAGAALVTRAREGDEAARRALYEKHAPWVSGLAARMLRNRDEAADVLQDVFVIAFERLDTLREPAAFRAWLARITTSLVRRRRLKKRFLRVLGLDDGGEDDGLDRLAGSWVSAEARAELTRIDRALQRVPERCRDAWLLRNVEGEALEDVAGACGCSLATVKRWIAAADEEIARAIAPTEAAR